ncbi:hypothetical protein RIF29_40143 [Crotalaria pallida]|uniref:F-box domain-containing protein n=1 Tax=Crotalaria pallida TaxID=3830 RepID=A0AAN9E2Z6_CROPI
MAASIVEEIFLEEILVCLPVKSLMRFKCVSKRWLSQISDPSFCRSHTLRHFTPFPTALLDPLLFSGLCNFLTLLPPPPPPSSSSSNSNSNSYLPCAPFIIEFQFLVPNPLEIDFILMQSCNGLVLVRRGKFPSYLYYVCNPITKQFLALNLPTSTDSSSINTRGRRQELHLAFEPLRSSHYAVILIRFDPIDIHVYSSKIGCWTHLAVTDPDPETTFFLRGNGVYCNGAIYWHCADGRSVCFDIENQCFKSFPLPMPRSDRVLHIGESGGRLHLIVLQCSDELLLDIFELKEDSSEWSVMSRVDLRGLFDDIPMVLCYFRQKNEQDSILVFYKDKQVVGLLVLMICNVMTLLAYAAVGLTLNINACCLTLDAHHLIVEIPKLMAFIYTDQRVMPSPNISKVYYLDQVKATFIVVLLCYIVCVMDAYQFLFMVANAEEMEVALYIHADVFEPIHHIW